MNKIIIDNRENELKLLLKGKDFIEEKQLDIGDINFIYQDKSVLIIERKTVNDFYASIKDGRHREQKARLLSNFPRKMIYYLIEGSLSDFKPYKSNPNSDKILYSAFLNTMIRDDIKIIFSKNINETVKIIISIYEKMNKSPEFFIDDNKNTTGDYINTIKIKKKDNINPEICLSIMLAQIPGVSYNISQAINEEYSSLTKLILKYNENTDEVNRKLLSNIKINISNNKTRRIGDVVSERIYKFLKN